MPKELSYEGASALPHVTSRKATVDRVKKIKAAKKAAEEQPCTDSMPPSAISTSPEPA